MISPRWSKVLKDLLENKPRTILVVLAIAVGLLAFGSILIVQIVVGNDMNEGYQATNPADMVIYGWRMDERQVRMVEAMRPVADAEGWATFWLKMKVDDRWMNIDLYSVKDFENMQINRIEPLEGDWPPGRKEIFFERAALPVIGAEIGDTVTLELPDGTQRELVVGGIVHDLDAEPPTLSVWLRGYVSLETLQWLGHDGYYSRIRLNTVDSVGTEEQLEEAADEIRRNLERSGYMYNVSSRDASKHWAADGFNGFVAILSGVGGFAMVLSGFLVVNTITALLSQQKRQIGMMKAVGAKRGQITLIYLANICALGLLALFVSIPVGLLIAYYSVKIIANFLNIDVLHFYLPLQVLLIELAMALIVPVIAGMVPVLRGTGVTVRQAVSDYGITLRKKEGLLDRILVRLRGLSRPVLLSIRNTFRRKGRLALTLCTLSLAGAIFISVINVRHSLDAALQSFTDLFGYDVQVYLDDSYGILRLQREAGRVPDVKTVEGWAFANARRIRPDNTESEELTILGPPADTDIVRPNILEGRWLEPNDQTAIVLSSGLLEYEEDIKVGDWVTLEIGDRRRKWEVVGILDGGLIDDIAYANYDYLSHLTGAPRESWILFAQTFKHDQDTQSKAARALEERLKRSGISVSQSLTQAEDIGQAQGQFDFMIGFLMFMAGLLAVVGGLGLASTMSLNVIERTREIGVMRAIGAANGSVRNVVLAEGLVIGLLSWFFGAVLAFPISFGFDSLVGNAMLERPLEFIYSPTGALGWLGVALVIVVLACLLPALRAIRISVREALAYE